MSLIGCSTKTIVKTEYIRQEIPDLPEEPEYYQVKWHMCYSFYCIDAENAKALLKNRALDKAYQEELRTILEHLRTGFSGQFPGQAGEGE